MPQFDVSHIRELGNQWITVGQNFWEYLGTMHGSMQSLAGAWTGKAGRAAQVVWNGGGQHNVWQAFWEAGYVAQEIGKAIISYADEMQKVVDDIQNSYLIQALTAIFGAVLGIASFGIGGLLGRIASIVANATQKITSAISLIASFAGRLGQAAAFTVNVASGVALQLVIDLSAQALAQVIGRPNTPVSIHWEGEAQSLPWAVLPMGLGGRGNQGHAPAPHVNPGMDVPHVVPHVTPAPAPEGASTPRVSANPVKIVMPDLAIPSLNTQSNHALPGAGLTTPVIETPRAGAGGPGKDVASPEVVRPGESGFVPTPGVPRPESPVPFSTGHAAPVYTGGPVIKVHAASEGPVPQQAFLEPRPGTISGVSGHPDTPVIPPAPHQTVTGEKGITGAGADVPDTLPLPSLTGAHPSGGAGRESILATSPTPRGTTPGETPHTTATSHGADAQAVRGSVGATRIPRDGGAGQDTLTSAPAPGSSHETTGVSAGASTRVKGATESAGRLPNADPAPRSGSPETVGGARSTDAMPQTSRDAAAPGGGRSQATGASSPTDPPAKGRLADQRSTTGSLNEPATPRSSALDSETSAGTEPETARPAPESLASSASASPALDHHDIGAHAPVHGGDRRGDVVVDTHDVAHDHGGVTSRATSHVSADTPGYNPAHDAGASPARDSAGSDGSGIAADHPVPDHASAEAAQLEQWNAFKQRQNDETLLLADAEARVDRMDLDGIWQSGHEKYALFGEAGAKLDAHEVTQARWKWRTDITRALREEIRTQGRVSSEAFEGILDPARENAYKYLIREDLFREYSARFKVQIDEYKALRYGYGEELPSLGNLKAPHTFDAALNMYVKDDSKLHGYPSHDGKGPEYAMRDSVSVDYFRDKRHDLNPLEKMYLEGEARFEKTLGQYLHDGQSSGPLPRGVRDQLEMLLDREVLRQDLDKFAVRERDIRLTWEEHFEQIPAKDLEGIPEQVLSQVELDVRMELRAAHDKSFASGVTELPHIPERAIDESHLANVTEELHVWTRPIEDLGLRIQREDFIRAQVEAETGHAESYLLGLGTLREEMSQRVLGEFLSAVRLKAGQHFTDWVKGGQRAADQVKWIGVRDDLRASLPGRVRYEGTLQGVVTEAAHDFHAILQHPDSPEAFHLADATRDRLGGQVESDRVRAHIETFAPEHNAEAWSAHESQHENNFAAELADLRSDVHGHRPGAGGDGPIVPSGPGKRPDQPKDVAPAVTPDDTGMTVPQDYRTAQTELRQGPASSEDGSLLNHSPQEQLQVLGERPPSTLRDTAVHSRTADVSPVGEQRPVQELEGASVAAPTLADAVRERLPEREQSAVSDAEVSGVYQRPLEQDSSIGRLPAEAQAPAAAARLLEDKALLHMSQLADGVRARLAYLEFASVSDAEVRRLYQMASLEQSGFAGLRLEAQVDVVVERAGESFARSVSLLSGGSVDVATVRRIDAELVRELGDSFWQLDGAHRAGDVAQRVLQERALGRAAEIVEGRAGFVRGQERVRLVLDQLVREQGEGFSARPVDERVAEVVAGVRAERELVRAVNLVRGSKDFVRGTDVLPEHSSLLSKRGDAYRQLPVREKALLVAEALEAEQAPKPASPSDQAIVHEVSLLLRHTDYTFAAADIDLIHETFLEERGGYQRLPLQAQAARVADSFVKRQKELESVANVALQERGLRTISGGEIQRIHDSMAEKLGEPFLQLSVEARGERVAEWARRESDLIRKVNSLPGGRTYREDRVRSMIERLLQHGQPFLQLPPVKQARVVAEALEAERVQALEVTGSVLDSVQAVADSPNAVTQAPAVDAVGDRAAAEPLSVRDEEHDVVPATAAVGVDLSALADGVRARLAYLEFASVSDAEVRRLYQMASLE
ncbi:hypothetical protein ACFZBE_39340, partial [Streptomyces sp. NPDC008061]|uniref:hypothetical protein n=1 Tax=Streptomyces sp. NPDC008061 TaxID=3364805 RepID=UPI0036EAE365